MSTAPSTARPTSSRPTSPAPSTCLKPPAPTGQRAGPQGLPLPPHLDRRGLRLPWPRGPVHRTHALRPPLALFRVQGRVRPSGPRLAETYGLPVVLDQLLQQLRPLPLPGKADPGHHPERAARRPIPVYGNGENIRDWLYVEDHADALLLVLRKGRNWAAATTSAARTSAATSTSSAPSARFWTRWPRKAAPYADQITFVTDRPGHDARYAIDPSRIRAELGWRPSSRSKRACAAPSAGIWTTKPGGARF
jgi:hypothetical protein